MKISYELALKMSQGYGYPKFRYENDKFDSFTKVTHILGLMVLFYENVIRENIGPLWRSNYVITPIQGDYVIPPPF